MAQSGPQQLGWARGWSLVKQVREKPKFVAVFDTREDAEAAAAEAGVDYPVCFLSYEHGFGFHLNEIKTGNPSSKRR